MGLAEKMIEAGESMEKGGKSTASAGCGIFLFVLAVVFVLAIAIAFVAC